MPSTINASVPADGSEAVSTPLRDNFAAAEAELNHGGFVADPTAGGAEATGTAALAAVHAARVTAFDGLSDTPSSKSGQGGKYVAVNTGATALEYVAGSPESADAVTTNYLPGGTGAVTRTVQAKLRELSVTPQDYGAVADGIADDSAAIEAAIAFVKKPAPNDGGKTIFFPRGKYRITRPVLAHIPSGGSLYNGPIHFRGENWYASRIQMDPPTANEVFMYDSLNVPAYYRSLFSDLAFDGIGTNANFASVFRQWSDPPPNSHEQAIKCTHCNFGGSGNLGTVMAMVGTYNASTNTFRDCQIRNTRGPALIFDNVQAVTVQLYGTDCEFLYSDLIRVNEGGGGDVIMIGGSHIGGWGTEKTWLLNLAGSVNVDHFFTFIGVRTELRYQNAGLVKKDNASLAGGSTVVFRDSHLRPGIDVSNVDQEWVRIQKGVKILFDNTQLPTVGKYRILTGGDWDQPENGSLDFENCRVPPDLAEQIIFDGSYGRASARRCRPYTAAYDHVVDFDLNWQNQARQGRAVYPKTAVLKGKARTWPHSGGSSEHTVRLPIHARIIGIRVLKPAGGSGTVASQYHVGSNDKATIYASSASAAQNAQHLIDWKPTLAEQIDVGIDLNKRTVRLWHTGATATAAHANIAGEIAIVEYL